MKIESRLSFWVGLVLVVSLTGCKNDLLEKAPGKYRGTLLTRMGESIHQTLTWAEVTTLDKNRLGIEVHPGDTKDTFKLSFAITNEKKVEVDYPDWQNFSLGLEGSPEGCLASEPSNLTRSALLCFNGTDLILDLAKEPEQEYFSLRVSQAINAEELTFEEPKSYTVSDLIQRSLLRNFDTAIEYQSVVVAKLKMETGYTNLLPHISANTALSIASLSIAGYLKAVADLAPFLFPTRWFAASAAKYKSQAEFDAYILSKANAANLVEGLSYIVLRDTMLMDIIDKNRKEILEVRNQIQVQEHTGSIQVGTSDDIESILNLIDSGYESLRTNLLDEKISLAEGAGFYNYAAITSVVLPDDIPIAQYQPYTDENTRKMATIAWDRSYERRQLNFLIQSADSEAKGRYFQFLDPEGDYQGQLGFSLPTYIQIGYAQEQMLVEQRDKLEESYTKSVARAVNQSNLALSNYGIAKDGLDIQIRRIQRQTNNLHLGINFSALDLAVALQEKMRAELSMVTYQAGFAIAAANLNRLLLAGPYAHVPTGHPEPSWVISTDTGPLNGLQNVLWNGPSQ